jgi:chloramphenicol-sensitive protein RarD
MAVDGEQRRGLEAAIVAYVGWGLLTVYWKQLADLDPVDLVGWRVATASVVMTVWLVVSRRAGTLRQIAGDRATLGNVVVASALITVNWSTYVWAVVNGHVIDTALGYFLAPLLTMAVGVFVLGEQLSRLKWASVACAVAALAVLIGSYGKFPWVAVLLAVSWSTYGFIKRRVALDPIASLTAEMLVLVVPAVTVVAISFTRSDGVPNQANTAEMLLVLGTGAITAAPLLLFAYAAKRVPFTILGPANYLIPIINFLLGWLAYGEALPASRVVGFVLVWMALALVAIDTMTGKKSESRDRHTPGLASSRSRDEREWDAQDDSNDGGDGADVEHDGMRWRR